MDDEESGEQGARTRRNGEQQHPKLKYMEMLQRVADRKQNEIRIELDDLDAVSSATCRNCGTVQRLTRKIV
jgi:hypothetical protein